MEEKRKISYIPKNIVTNKRILGFKKLNLLEAIVELIILLILIALTPFVADIRRIIFFCFGVFILLLNYIGIQGNSIIQTLVHLINYKKKTKKTYSYRRYKDGVKRDDTEVVIDGKIRGIKENVSNNRFRQFFGL